MAKNKGTVEATPDSLAKVKAQQMAKGQSMSPESIGSFFKEAWIELKKTTWPDKNTLTKSTMIVVAFIFAAAVCVGGLDDLLTILTNNLLTH